MGNPFCPFCGGVLKLETLKIPEEVGPPKTIADFYVCHKDKKHWFRHASIMKETAIDGVKPKPRKRFGIF